MSTPLFAPTAMDAPAPALPHCRCGHSAKNHQSISGRVTHRRPIDPERAHGCMACDCGWEVRVPTGYAPDLTDAAVFTMYAAYQRWAGRADPA